jgi:putative phosphoribosyl transferase
MASGSGPVVPFPNRRAGGAALAALLSARRALDPDPVVVALPRGGVPVGVEVADALGAPLDVIIVRKLGTPGQPELAMGAIGEGGARILNHEVLDALRITDGEVEAVAAREQQELDRRAQRLRAGRARVPLTGHTAILVDDGLATGSTARAAILVARAPGARRVVVATPVAPRSTVVELGDVADAVVCVATPEPFRAIGQWYVDFRPTSDDQVVALLDR